MSHTRVRLIAATVVLAATAGAAPAAEGAKPKPGAVTGKARGVTPDSARLGGAVRPRGTQVSYSFQYGTTRKYEATTPEVDAGKGEETRYVAATVGGLAPATRYHYRIVVRSKRGVVKGENRTFRTRKQPLGLVLSAAANPVNVGEGPVLAGTLSGTENDRRRLTLESQPFPYTSAWLPVPGVNDVVTDAAAGGAFTFRLPPIGLNTQYRVTVAGRPQIVSPIVAIGVKPRVTVRVPRRVFRPRGSRRATIGWRGTITPRRDGAQVLIQKWVKRDWRTIGVTSAQAGTEFDSRYRDTVRQRRGGRFRVLVTTVDGALVPNTSREHTISVRSRKRR